jgi:membrane fusion protein
MLFREAAIEERRSRLSGHVLISTPFSYSIVTLLIFSFVITALVFIAFAAFPRIERVAGYLVPSAGIVIVASPVDGLLGVLDVSEGQVVSAGETLGLVSAASESAADTSRVAAQLRGLEARISGLRIRQEVAMNAARLELESLQRREEALFAQIQRLQNQLELRNRILQEYEAITDRNRTLVARGAISASALSEHVVRLLGARTSVQESENTLAMVVAEHETLPLARAQAQARAEMEQMTIIAELNAAESERAIIQSTQIFEIKSTLSGSITAVQARSGQRVANGQTLFSVLPVDTQLQAEILVPSSARGFIQTGQTVSFMLDAFPYQRFGTLEGIITDISATVLPHGAAPLPVSTNSPVYRVRVSLAQQTLFARGEERTLQPGMTLNASIILEERTVLVWLLDPFLSVARRT